MVAQLHIALLAAGASRRMMGRDKLLEQIGGLALLRRQALAILEANIGPLAVTLRAPDPERLACLTGLNLTTLPVPEAAEGMSASLRAAAQWAGDNPLMICPADMPDLTSADFAACAAAYDGHPIRATSADGKPGHPVIFQPALTREFHKLRGDEGARSLLKSHPPKLFALPGQNALTDLDTPEDWDRFRAQTFSC